MGLTETFALSITEPSAVAEARRRVSRLATRLGLSETEAGQAAIVVSEAATNLLKHGGGGQLLVRGPDGDDPPAIEVLALDRGSGMADVGTALRDGYSTTGTAGTGLGAMMRLSAVFDVYSSPRSGTAVFVRLGTGASRTPRLVVGGVVVAKPGEDVSGDAWAADLDHGCNRILLTDGLGYGVRAAEASREAIRIFRQSASFRPGQALQAIHAALRATRGAAVAIAELDSERGVLTFAGVGNVAGVIYSEAGSRNLVSHNGTAGLEARKIQEFTYPWGPGCVLIMHSDGLKTHWSLDNYPGLARRHPSLIAGVLYRDFTRGPDDVSVVVARHAAA